MLASRLTAWIRPALSLLATAGVLSLAACGGGSGAPNNPFTPLPTPPGPLTVEPAKDVIAYAGTPLVAVRDGIVAVAIEDVVEEVRAVEVGDVAVGPRPRPGRHLVEAAEVANEAGVQLLVLYHLTPPPPLKIAEWVFTRGVSDVRPDGWLLADDGLLVELPRDSSAVTTRWLR